MAEPSGAAAFATRLAARAVATITAIADKNGVAAAAPGPNAETADSTRIAAVPAVTDEYAAAATGPAHAGDAVTLAGATGATGTAIADPSGCAARPANTAGPAAQ